MSGNDPWGDLKYLLSRKGRSASYADLIEPFKPSELLAPVRKYHTSFPATVEMKRAAEVADAIWWDIHETFATILAYSGWLDGT